MENIKKPYKNISAPMWNEEFQLSDRSYSVSDIQDYFGYIIKKHQIITNNHPVRT